MRYRLKQFGWVYKEHFWFAWRPVIVDRQIVFREWLVRWKVCNGGPNAYTVSRYRNLTKLEASGGVVLQNKVIPKEYRR